MDWKEIINLLAILLSPIVAVIVGQALQIRSNKRKDKVQIFETRMTWRAFGWGGSITVNAINSIPLAFHDNQEILNQLSTYLKSLDYKQEELTENKRKEIQKHETKLLEEMAKSLGYKKINWEIIQNPYVSTGLVNELKYQNDTKDANYQFFELLWKAAEIFPKATFADIQQTKTKETYDDNNVINIENDKDPKRQQIL